MCLEHIEWEYVKLVSRKCYKGRESKDSQNSMVEYLMVSSEARDYLFRYTMGEGLNSWD